MLLNLHIENIAVIERADVSFREGLNVLTGETGAGKSIVIDALHAVTGARTSRDLVRRGARKGLVSAVFDTAGAESWCAEAGVEPEEDTLIVTRQIAADGKSACRVNGVPVTAAQLRSLGAALVDIHGQDDGRQLMDEARHIDYLDSFAGIDRREYNKTYTEYRAIEKEIHTLRSDDDSRRLLAESLQYRVQELEKAGLRAGEESELEARSMLLRNGERLREAVSSAYAALYDGDTSAIDLTGSARGHIAKASQWSAELADTERSLAEAEGMLRDSAETLRDLIDSLDFSPEEFDQVESRLAQLRRLEKKFGAVDESGLIGVLEDAKHRLSELTYGEEALGALLERKEKLKKQCREEAAAITEARRDAAGVLGARVEKELRDLSMPSARFVTDISPLPGDPGFGPKGADEVVFRMSANAGDDPGRIAKIASGGELSRIMLAVKSVFGEIDPVPVSVYDEIDTGVSGIAANRVGEKLSRIGRLRQVLCVSHLPQIAAMADAQYCIEKTERDGKTFTTVRELDREGRKRELARLAGGENITELSLASAEELLADADQRKRG